MNQIRSTLLLLIFLACSAFQSSSCPDLIRTSWVLIAYTDTYEGIFVELSPEQYQTGCSKKYVLSFDEKGHLTININDKMTFDGDYSVKPDCKIDISSRIIVKIVDIDTVCTVDDGTRIVVDDLLDEITSYKMEGDVLVFYDPKPRKNDLQPERPRFGVLKFKQLHQ